MDNKNSIVLDVEDDDQRQNRIRMLQFVNFNISILTALRNSAQKSQQ